MVNVEKGLKRTTMAVGFVGSIVTFIYGWDMGKLLAGIIGGVIMAVGGYILGELIAWVVRGFTDSGNVKPETKTDMDRTN